MNIDIRDLITLSDGNKYIVISKVYYDNNDYLYLVDVNENNNLKYCYIEDDSIVEITDEELNKKLLPLFFERAKDIVLSWNN